jgi:activator of HSP90 ATPase
VDSVTSVTGDVDLNQRKGKVMHIYDIAINLKWSGQLNGKEVKGTIVIPEIMHDTELHEIVFDVTLEKDTKENDVVKQLVRKQLCPLIRDSFKDFNRDLLEQNTKDVYISASEMEQQPLKQYQPKAPVEMSKEDTEGLLS